MGVMRFLVHPPVDVAGWPEHQEAFISGFDGRIFPTLVDFDGQLLTCRRSYSDSGKVSLPWTVPGIGRPVISTTSLRESDQTYFLPLELARGKLSQVRDQAATWEMARMAIPSEFLQQQSSAFHALAHASATQNDPDRCAESAGQAISHACQAADILAHSYVVQRMASIRRSSHHAPNLIGTTLDETVLNKSGRRIFQENFNTGCVPIRWSDIEPVEGVYNWELIDELIEVCSENRAIVRGGPLISLDRGGLPGWLAPWNSDFLNLMSFVCDFVDTAVSRYTGRVRIWEISTGGNLGGVFNLTEEQCLSLTARTLEAGVRTDSDSQFFIRIEQPWGEYQRAGRHQLSPFQFVDALVRSNLGLSGVTLEINVGYSNRACFTRDLLSISQLIDLWSLLGLQIHVVLTCPSGSTCDSLADDNVLVRQNSLNEPWSESAQHDWMKKVVSLLIAKPTVTGVFLSQFSDGIPHRFPHGGLLSTSGQPKKMLSVFQDQSGFDSSFAR